MSLAWEARRQTTPACLEFEGSRAFADRGGDSKVEDKIRNDIEQRCECNRLMRLQNTGGHHGRDGVRCIVEPVHEIKDEGYRDEQDHRPDDELNRVHVLTCSGVFEHDALDYLGGGLALVGDCLEQFIDALQLDQCLDILLLPEQSRDRDAQQPVNV